MFLSHFPDFFYKLARKKSNQILLSYHIFLYKVIASLLPAVVFWLFTIPTENKCMTVGAGSFGAAG